MITCRSGNVSGKINVPEQDFTCYKISFLYTQSNRRCCITRPVRLGPSLFPRSTVLPPVKWRLSAFRFLPSSVSVPRRVPSCQSSEDRISSVLGPWIGLWLKRAIKRQRTLPLAKQKQHNQIKKVARLNLVWFI